MPKDRDWLWPWEKDRNWTRGPDRNNDGKGAEYPDGDTGTSTAAGAPETGMKSLTSYYEETIRFLRIAGKEYSDAHPDTARYLNRDNLETAWPGFEDVLRGLGFLGARIHALLDRTRNDFYADLVHLFWPQLAVEVPSVTLAAFSPVINKLPKTLLIPRGTLLTSRARDHEIKGCTFSTTQDVRVSPLVLAGIDKKNPGLNAGELTLRFSLKEGCEHLSLDPLRIHLTGELPVTIALHELITRHVTHSRITVGEGSDRVAVSVGRNAATPGGIGPDEPLLPPLRHSCFALSYLTEYFVFREKFLCFDLHGLDGAVCRYGDKTPSIISVTFTFDCGLPEDKPFDAANFRLFCTPAVNLFRRTIEPVAARLTYDEYPLCADNASGVSVVFHSIIGVTSCNRSTGARVDYAPMTSFAAGPTGAPTWLLRYQSNAKLRRRDAFLHLGGRQPVNAPPDGENISVDAWCSNGDLPHAGLHEGDLAECGSLPAGVSVTNITRPTERAFPRDDVPLAVLTTQLGAYYEELTNSATFSAFLKAHDRSGGEGNRRRAESILKVTRTKTETSYKGTLLHGLRYTIDIDESAFSDLNDLHLFGQTLVVFLSLWSRMETYVDLLLVGRPSDRTLYFSSLENWLQSIDGRAPALPENDGVSIPLFTPDSTGMPDVDDRYTTAPEDAPPLPGADADIEKLIDKIEREACTLNFFGTIRFFEGYFAARDIPDPFKSGHLLLSPDTAFSFPSSEIVDVERLDGRFMVRCAFMGLSGASSPLPAQWSQIIIEKPETAAALLALLTAFNRRFYELFYEAHKKYRLDPLQGMYERDPLVRRIAALGGILPHNYFSRGELLSLSFISLFAASPRSATGLATMLSSSLGNIPVSIQRFMPHGDAIPPAQQTQLGSRNCMLGMDALLGGHIDNRAAKFRITCGPLKRSLFESILSTGHHDSMLRDLIESYIASTLDYDIALLIRYGDLPPAALGSKDGMGARLGVNAGLGAPADPLATNHVVIEGRTPGGVIKKSPVPVEHIAPSATGRSIDKYFEEDVRSLYESARVFASGFPRAGKELSITSTGAGDPAVARLFQGAAFLSARIREILDDTLPELTERLFHAEWPEFLHELPSATIVEFTPRRGSVSATSVLPRGTELLSKTIGSTGERAVFTTTQAVVLNPIRLESAGFSTDSKGKGRVELRFLLEKGVSWPVINLDPLRLYIHADERISFPLHRMFLHETDNVSIRYDDGGPGKEIASVNAVRFPFCGPQYRLLHTHSFKSTGYASLLEYNAFNPKFLFIDLHGFHDERFSGMLTAPQSCTVTICFKSDFPSELSFGKDIFKLFCSPAVNLFKRNGALLPTGITNNEYVVAAAADASGTLVPHSVHAVSGLDKTDEGPREYIQKHETDTSGPTTGTGGPRFRQGYDGKRSIVLERGHGIGANARQTPLNITVSAFFTNGSVPHTDLDAGDIVFHATGFSDRIDFVNLTIPTLPTLPPRGEKQWLFLALAVATPTIPLNVLQLKQLLKLFDWNDDADKNNVGNAIVDFYAHSAKWVKGGEMLRGMEYTLILDESARQRGNDLHIFGQVMGEFLRSKTPATSFVSFVMIAQPSGKTLKWERQQGSFGITTG